MSPIDALPVCSCTDAHGSAPWIHQRFCYASLGRCHCRLLLHHIRYSLPLGNSLPCVFLPRPPRCSSLIRCMTVEELDYGTPWWKIIIHLLCSVVIQPFASVAEGLAAIWAMSTEELATCTAPFFPQLRTVLTTIPFPQSRSSQSDKTYIAPSLPPSPPLHFSVPLPCRSPHVQLPFSYPFVHAFTIHSCITLFPPSLLPHGQSYYLYLSPIVPVSREQSRESIPASVEGTSQDRDSRACVSSPPSSTRHAPPHSLALHLSSCSSTPASSLAHQSLKRSLLLPDAPFPHLPSLSPSRCTTVPPSSS